MTEERNAPTEEDEAPKRPSNESRSELGFERRNRMVRWLSPTQLFHTGRQALFAVLISGYSDKREIEAALPSPGIFDRSDPDEVWIDFVSDLGDGFNPTYGLAYLLAKPSLDLPDPTPRGSILVMGGDQVYPAASQRRYRNRVVGPYRAALPYLPVDPPNLFVVPGNHDWFDGLTSFMRAFCQQGWVGAWRTCQTRSYFAIKLPHRWWLWGIDIQFDNYIDWPQLRYFRDRVSPKLAPGDGVIICVAKPSWVDANAAEPLRDPDLYTTFDYFERTTILQRGASVPLAISGDRHHYARYEEGGPGTRQRITCGGGGAFLSETHGLPESIEAPHRQTSDPSPTPSARYTLKTTYPAKVDSLRQAWLHAWSLLWRNDAFPALVGAVALLFGLMGRFAISREGQSFWAVPDQWWRNVLTWLFFLALLLALIRFTKTHGPRAWALGVAHTAMHLLGIAAAVWAAGRAADALFPNVSTDWHVGLTLGGTFILYALAGSEIFALYLLIADRFRVNRTELFASMRIQDRKNFLRLRIDADGCTVHPVKVEKVPRKWRLETSGDPGAPWFEPAGDPPTAELIESIDTIRRPAASPP
jgi:hypothetical protein